MATLLQVLALMSIFVANFNKSRDANEEIDRKVTIKSEYDFVIVGAGTTGSVVAARLAQHGQTVLLVEAGESGRGEVNIDIPFNARKLQGGERDWNFEIITQRKLGHERPLHYVAGKVAGGSSTFNYLNYVRGNEYDYRLWEDEGATGWNLQNLKKYFAKVEKATEDGMSDSLGRDGAVKLSKKYSLPIGNIFEKASNELGIKSVDYLDGGGFKIGVSSITGTVFNGVRQHAFNSYLFPEMSKPNSSLDVAFGAHADKILFKEVNGETKAYALKFTRNGKAEFVRFGKEIIVSAGFANTPKLLMLSGVGPKKHLKKMGIDLVADVTGVGSNAQDHISVQVHFYGEKLKKGDTIFVDEVLKSFPKYETNKTGPMSTVLLLQRMITARSKYFGTKYVKSSAKYPFPDFGIMGTGLSLTTDFFPDPFKVFTKAYEYASTHRNKTLFHFALAPFITHPLSRGTVRLRSSDPNDPPLYNPNYYGNRWDKKLMRAVMRFVESFESSAEFKKHGIKMSMIPDVCAPMQTGIPRSRSFLNCFLEQQTKTIYHGSSTCKMGFKNDSMAVLDSGLRLHSIANVRVADASVFPHLVTANTQATCYAVGEKAADMITETWDL